MDKMLLARKLIQKYQTNNPFELCDYLNIMVIHLPLINIRGFFQYVLRNRIIYIDENLSEKEQTFVCAHELYHAIAHKDVNRIFMDQHTYQLSSRYEISADQFAVCILFPNDSDLTDYIDYPIEQIANMMGVPPHLAEYRMELIQGF